MATTSEDHGHDHDEHGHAHDDHGHEDHGHDGHDDHAHGHGLLAKVLGHSHDAADRLDAALEASDEGIRALKLSLAGLGLTAVLQVVVFVLSGSVALLGDTIHNLADAVTAVPLWLAFAVGRRTPTRRATYGYGRAEDLAGVAIVGVIAASSALAGYEALLRLLHPQDVHHPWAVVAAGLVGFLGNEAVAVLRIRVGTRIGSAALVADGHHARTDGLTSLGVVVGALGVVAGLRWADPLVGLLITVAIAFVLVRAAKEVLARLLDQVDEPLVERIEAVLAATPGVQAVDEVRARWVGHGLRAEATVEVDPQLTVGQAHDITSEAERRLVADVPRLVAATLHAHPLGEAGHLHEGPHAHAHADDHPHQDLRPTTGDGPVT